MRFLKGANILATQILIMVLAACSDGIAPGQVFQSPVGPGTMESPLAAASACGDGDAADADASADCCSFGGFSHEHTHRQRPVHSACPVRG